MTQGLKQWRPSDFLKKHDSERSLLNSFLWRPWEAVVTIWTRDLVSPTLISGSYNVANSNINGTSSPGAVCIPWSHIENIVVARGDVLFILDTRFSAGAEFPSLQPSSRTSGAEYLSASPGFERIAVACPDNCFTNKLTETLQNIRNPLLLWRRSMRFWYSRPTIPRMPLNPHRSTSRAR